MSWDSNRDKGEWVRNPWKRRNIKRRLIDEIKGEEPLSELRWDLEQEKADKKETRHEHG